MKRKVRLLSLIIAVCFVTLALTGCRSSRELNDLSIVTGIGIDKSEKPQNILLTAQVVKPDVMKKPSKDGAGGEGTAFWNVKREAQTVFNAVRELTNETRDKLYMAHTQIIVFGKDIASDGVQKYLDFFMRAREARPTTWILVSDSTAQKILDFKPETEKLPSMHVARLAKNQKQTNAHSMGINLQDFTVRLLSKTTSPIAPVVTITEENQQSSLKVEGMAVFKKDKMVDILNLSETRGLLWVLGEVKSGDIVVNYPNGKASIEILKVKSTVTPKIRNGKPTIHISIKEDGNLVSQMTPTNLATLPGIASLEQRQSKVIIEEIQAALNKSKSLNTDIFGFGDEFHKKYRSEWKLLESAWDKIYPGLKVEISVESHIKATGLITKPALPESVSEKE